MGLVRNRSSSKLASPLSAFFMGMALGGGCPNLMFLPNCRWRETKDRRSEAVRQFTASTAGSPAYLAALRQIRTQLLPRLDTLPANHSAVLQRVNVFSSFCSFPFVPSSHELFHSASSFVGMPSFPKGVERPCF